MERLLIDLDKALRFFPVGIREIICCIISKCALLVTGATATEA